jgi:hypothetical protein
MGKSLNIKDHETWELASELARLEGVSITKAVHDSLAEKLERRKADFDLVWKDWLENAKKAPPVPDLEFERDTSEWPERNW